MAAETSRPTANRNCCLKLKNRFSQSVITSKTALVCLIWSVLMNCVGIVTWIQWCLLLLSPGNEHLQNSFGNVVIIQSVSWFLYPVYGYLGERWTRYHVIMAGISITSGGSILIAIFLSLMMDDNQLINHIVLFVGSIMTCSGFGLFTVNIIQFGIDQIRHTSSQTLITFVQWSVFNNWVMFYAVGHAVINNNAVYISSATKYVLIALAYILCASCFLIGIYCKSYFIIEPPPFIDPLKLIILVLKYSWKHKYPVRRSAFTYSDEKPPSRLDNAKSRYGGPFTSDEVESVKSFWSILAIVYTTIITMSSYSTTFKLGNILKDDSFCIDLPRAIYRFLPFGLMFVPIILFQFVLTPCFPRFILNTLNRIWICLLAIALCSILNLFLQVFTSAHIQCIVVTINTDYLIADVVFMILNFTLIEFILAQAPYRMQGIFIGQCNINLGIVNGLKLYPLVMSILSHEMFLCIKTGVVCIMFAMYSIAMFCYSYRLRNEPSDINTRQKIEDVFDRDFTSRENDAIQNNSNSISVYEVDDSIQ